MKKPVFRFIELMMFIFMLSLAVAAKVPDHLDPANPAAVFKYFRDQAKKEGREKKKIDEIYNLIGKTPKPVSGGSIWQTDATYTKVTVSWKGTPEIANNENVEMLQWRLSWAEHGGSKWSSPVVRNYTTEECSYTIEGLASGHIYDVRVGYRYQNNLTGGFTNVDDWRMCDAATFIPATGNPSSWKYLFNGNGYIQLLVPAAKPNSDGNQYSWLHYQWYFVPGPAFNTRYKTVESSGRGESEWHNGNLELEDYPAKGGSAVYTFGIRTVHGFSNRSYSGWQTKRLVADPPFTVGWNSRSLEVTISNMKYADSYTVYIRKGNWTKSAKIKWKGNWKKAGTVRARSGKKTTKATISKYGNEKLDTADIVVYCVRVVTHTKYGNSPGLVMGRE